MPEPLKPADQPDEIRLAIRAWNLLGGIDWAGIPVVADVLGITDIETLIVQLRAIQRHQTPDAHQGE